MEHLTPPRPRPSSSASAAAIDANARSRLMAMLTPPRGRLSTAALTSPLAIANFRRDEDSVSSFDESSSDMEENECCICLQQLIADDIASISGCEHTFCTECITRWADTRNVCPICRTRFTSIESADGALQQVSDRLSAAATSLEIILQYLLGLGREEVEEVFWRSVHEYEAYWSVIGASLINTLNEITERCDQLTRRAREVERRAQEAGERTDQWERMNREVIERFDDITRLNVQIRDETRRIIRDAVEKFDSALPFPTLANLPTLRRAVQIVINRENVFELNTEMLANLQA